MSAIVILPVLRAYNEIDGVQVLASLTLDLPGLTTEQAAQVSINNPSAMPPLDSEPDYAAVWVVAPQAILDILKAQANTLFVISLDNENKWVSIPLAPQARVQIVNKLKSFGYDGGRFGLINAAIQASQNSTQAAVIILTQIYAIEDPFVYYLFDTEAVA